VTFSLSLVEAQRLLPQYEFIKALTPSAQKAAFQVRDTTGDLCVKFISPEYEISRLSREITALQKISHRNVARLIEHHYSVKDGAILHYMVEEFVAGSDLAERLIPRQPWSAPKACQLFAQIADGLSAIEQCRVVHRDLKPHNIRIRPDDTPVIIDFGTARLLDLPDLTNTGEGAAFGTPMYFAPEQFSGTKHDIDSRTDFFALGVMLYQALTGEHPFYADGMKYLDLQNHVINSSECFNNPNFVGLRREIALVVRRLLSKDRLSRPSSAAQVAALLRRSVVDI
jgi:serine/threonine-protein kinase